MACFYWLGLQGQRADLIVQNYTIIFPQLNVHFLESSSVFNKVLTFIPQKKKKKKKRKERKSSVFIDSNMQFENE